MRSLNSESVGIFRKQIGRILRRTLLSHTRRLRDSSVVTAVVDRSPHHASKHLDIGSSDGRIAFLISEALGSEVQGVDVEVKNSAQIPVQRYNGTDLPFENESFDLVSIVDVLHHCSEPERVMFEALRVLRGDGLLVIKDHLQYGRWSNMVLSLMDVWGNFGQHQIVTGRYLSISDWIALIGSAGGRLVELQTPFRVHPLPWRLLARDHYHAVFSVIRSRERFPLNSETVLS